MKKAFLIVSLLLVLVVLASCSNGVRIKQNCVCVDNLVLSIRNGYRLAEDVYSIVDTENGYDIVVHVEKGE